MDDVLKEIEETLKEEIEASIRPNDHISYPMDYTSGLIHAYRLVRWAQGKDNSDEEEIEKWEAENGWLARAAKFCMRQKDVDNLCVALESLTEVARKADLSSSEYMQGFYNAIECLNSSYEKRETKFYPFDVFHLTAPGGE